jgi:hypothetical protein
MSATSLSLLLSYYITLFLSLSLSLFHSFNKNARHLRRSSHINMLTNILMIFDYQKKRKKFQFSVSYLCAPKCWAVCFSIALSIKWCFVSHSWELKFKFSLAVRCIRLLVSHFFYFFNINFHCVNVFIHIERKLMFCLCNVINFF